MTRSPVRPGAFASPQDRVRAALRVADQWGQVDGAHHKAWCIDQMVRMLTGPGYADWVASRPAGWDEGIAP